MSRRSSSSKWRPLARPSRNGTTVFTLRSAAARRGPASVGSRGTTRDAGAAFGQMMGGPMMTTNYFPLVECDHGEWRTTFQPKHPVKVRDVSGAGDTVAAVQEQHLAPYLGRGRVRPDDSDRHQSGPARLAGARVDDVSVPDAVEPREVRTAGRGWSCGRAGAGL